MSLAHTRSLQEAWSKRHLLLIVLPMVDTNAFVQRGDALKHRPSALRRQIPFKFSAGARGRMLLLVKKA